MGPNAQSLEPQLSIYLDYCSHTECSNFRHKTQVHKLGLVVCGYVREHVRTSRGLSVILTRITTTQAQVFIELVAVKLYVVKITRKLGVLH